MSDQTPGDGGAKEPTIQELQTQIENLNKGIGKYRSEASEASKTAAEATAKAEAAVAEAAAAKAEAEKLKGSKSDDDDIKLSASDQKRLEKWAKEQGFATKAEMEAEKSRLFNDSIRNIESQAIEEFTKAHPEYEDEEKWELVKKEFGQYKQPTSITAYKQILNKIHKELSNNEEAEAKVRAQEEKRKRLGLGGGSQKDSEASITLEKLQEKYPRLSAEQIESRLTEINQLAEERAKRRAAKK